SRHFPASLPLTSDHCCLQLQLIDGAGNWPFGSAGKAESVTFLSALQHTRNRGIRAPTRHRHTPSCLEQARQLLLETLVTARKQPSRSGTRGQRSRTTAAGRQGQAGCRVAVEPSRPWSRASDAEPTDAAVGVQKRRGDDRARFLRAVPPAQCAL